MPVLLLSGVSLSGKTSLSHQLKASGLPVTEIIEGDDLHPAESIEKMRFGQPLDDSDRTVWKKRICQQIAKPTPPDQYRLITCSALTRAFRQDLRQAGPLRILFLTFDRKSAEKRAQKRLQDTWELLHTPHPATPHFYQPAIYPALLDGQYRDLALPSSDETDCLLLDLNQYPQGPHGPQVDFQTLAPKILAWLQSTKPAPP